jgi:hypothetical protein
VYVCNLPLSSAFAFRLGLRFLSTLPVYGNTLVIIEKHITSKLFNELGYKSFAFVGKQLAAPTEA